MLGAKAKLKSTAKNVTHYTFHLQEYLSEEVSFLIEHRRNFLRTRAKLCNIAAHFPNRYNSKMCQLGCDERENLEHLTSCRFLPKHETIQINQINDGTSDQLKVITLQLLKIIEARSDI